MEFEFFHTERLRLQKLSPEGFRYLFEHHTAGELKQILGLKTDEDLAREKQKAEGGYRTYDRSIMHFKLALRHSGEVIGGGGFHNWYPMHRKAELGYALNSEEHKQKGYMSEAVAFMIDYGFRHMELNRIEACVGPDNVASLSLMRKFGFTREGYLRRHYIRDGEVQDSVIFSLLREEYPGR